MFVYAVEIVYNLCTPPQTGPPTIMIMHKTFTVKYSLRYFIETALYVIIRIQLNLE